MIIRNVYASSVYMNFIYTTGNERGQFHPFFSITDFSAKKNACIFTHLNIFSIEAEPLLAQEKAIVSSSSQKQLRIPETRNKGMALLLQSALSEITASHSKD